MNIQQTIVERIYCVTSPDAEPFGIDSTHQTELAGEVGPFSRQYIIRGWESEKIDPGWVEECGMVHIENKSNEHLVIECNDRVISGLPPKSSIRLFPPEPLEIVNCSKDIARVTATVFPKSSDLCLPI